VQAPLNSIGNAITILMIFSLGSAVLLATSLVASLASQNQRSGWIWLMFEPKASGNVLVIAIVLQREFYYLAGLVSNFARYTPMRNLLTIDRWLGLI